MILTERLPKVMEKLVFRQSTLLQAMALASIGKGPTVAAIAWLKRLVLPEIDRMEMNHLLADLEQVEKRLKELEQVIAQRSSACKDVTILSSMPGIGGGLTAISLACRVGRVERFPRAHSLANYWGLTPGCRNSSENDQRLGRITKAGSTTARWLLAQLVHKVLEGTLGYGSGSNASNADGAPPSRAWP